MDDLAGSLCIKGHGGERIHGLFNVTESFECLHWILVSGLDKVLHEMDLDVIMTEGDYRVHQVEDRALAIQEGPEAVL